jgi:transcriptional regulator with XRE-family HTH domain
MTHPAITTTDQPVAATVHAEPAVEALLAEIRAKKSLPPPAQRKGIRVAAGARRRPTAAAVGISEMTLWRWESGERSPSGKYLERYLEVLRLLQESV